ncbi:hypothetical protein [Nonomuraea ceibae]|uniref:hypothetical protein n=1 Tax=Nonomuraea ceibae TaxID=1935170 RepID=UPI001C5F62FA|nr:hypothetical protein [Nonomuraea ceibae]
MLTVLATALGLWLWKDFERHQPGIGSVQLSPEVTASRKQRIRIRGLRTTHEYGNITKATMNATARATC